MSEQPFPYMHPMMMARGMMPGYPRMPMGMPPMGMMQPMPYPMPMPVASSSQPETVLPTDKEALGERLYPMIEKVDPENASKITGMLLEMDVDELHNILKNPSQIERWVIEAKNVLNSTQGGQP